MTALGRPAAPTVELEQSLLADLAALSDDDIAERLSDQGGVSR